MNKHYSEKYPVVNNIISLNNRLTNMKKKIINNSYDNGNITYNISFLTGGQKQINPSDYPNQYGFVVEINQTFKTPTKILDLVYSDGEQLTIINPKLYDTAMYHYPFYINIESFGESTPYMYVMYMPYYSRINGKEIIENVWVDIYDGTMYVYEDIYFPQYHFYNDSFYNGQTIIHNMPYDGNINEINIGDPVFKSSFDKNIYYIEKSKNGKYKFTPITNTETLLKHSTDQLFKVGRIPNNNFVGVITKIFKNVDNKSVYEENTVQFASHGDFLFKVEDNSIYEVGDIINYNGMIINDDNYVENKDKIVGKITNIPKFNDPNGNKYVSIYRM